MGILNRISKKSDIPTAEEKKEEIKKDNYTGKYPALLLKQAWITEKAGDLSTMGKYVFIVGKEAGKKEIKKAVESIYKVNAVSVNVVNSKGKTKRMGRSLGRTSSFKKAIVTLEKGQKIDIMPH